MVRSGMASIDRSLDPLRGASIFPFIGQGKARVTAKEKEEQEREEGLQNRRVLLLLHAGHVDPVDVNRDSSMSWPYPSSAPCVGVVSLSWRSILS